MLGPSLLAVIMIELFTSKKNIKTEKKYYYINTEIEK